MPDFSYDPEAGGMGRLGQAAMSRSYGRGGPNAVPPGRGQRFWDMAMRFAPGGMAGSGMRALGSRMGMEPQRRPGMNERPLEGLAPAEQGGGGGGGGMRSMLLRMLMGGG